MGSSASIENQPDPKNDTSKGPGENKDTPNPNTDTKRQALKATNPKLNNNKDNKDVPVSNSGPLIAVRSDENDNINVEDKSANVIKHESKKEKKARENEQRIAEEKKRDAAANKAARIANLKTQLKKRSGSIKEAYKDVELDFDTIEDIESDIKHLQKGFDYSTLVDPIVRQEQLYQEYIKTTTKKDQLVMRISELAGARLKHNNPNIADLSDENRASRLSAKFSELYDNEYTDLFEVYCAKLPETTEEKVAIYHLRDSLKYIYTRCKKAAAGQRTRLIHFLHKDCETNPDTAAVGLKLRIKEFQKLVAKFTITSLQSSVNTGINEEKDLQLLIDTIKPHHSGSNPHLRHYLDRCTELCWYTQIQDPPVVLDFDLRSNLADYRSYTRSGPHMDYIVWPVFLLHEDGPILYKGVAQFKGDRNGNEGRTEVRSRRLSMRNGTPSTTKREPGPYQYIPPSETDDPTKHNRVEIVEW